MSAIYCQRLRSELFFAFTVNPLELLIESKPRTAGNVATSVLNGRGEIEMNSRSTSIAFVTLLLLTYAVPAHAYIDPGSGSFLLQMMVAGAVGGAFAVKSFWNNIKHSVHRVVSKKLRTRPE